MCGAGPSVTANGAMAERASPRLVSQRGWVLVNHPHSQRWAWSPEAARCKVLGPLLNAYWAHITSCRGGTRTVRDRVARCG